MQACPCGGQPELIEENADMNLSLKGVRCKKCGEAIPIIHDHAPEAIQAWNDWAGGRQSTIPETAGAKHVGISDWLGLGSYDPNVRWARHTIEVRLAQWQYGLSVTTTVDGNTRGASIIRSAIDSVCEKLEEEGCTMTDRDGDTLRFDAGETMSDEYEAMVVGARITSHEKKES